MENEPGKSTGPTFLVSRECLALGLRAAGVVLRGVDIAPSGTRLRGEIAAEVQRVRRQYASLAEVRATPELTRLYEVFKAVGAKPRRNPPSTDRLFQLALKKGELPAINNLVDAYNLMSLRFKASLGAHDLDRIALPVELRLLVGDEPFTLLGQTEAVAVVAGEFGYVDGANRLLCRLDVVQADFSKVTASTSDALLIIEATTAHDEATREELLRETVAIVARECGGTAEVIEFASWHSD